MKTNMLSYYDPDKRLFVIDRRYANDPLPLYHEFMRYVLSPSGVPSGTESRLWAYVAIESGLALYFPSSFLNNPRPSSNTDFDWDLSGARSFTELRPTFVSAQTDGAAIWGAAFWEIRQKLSQEKADKLLFDGWGALRAAEVATDRGAAFVRKLLDLDKANQMQIREIFAWRGMTA